MFAIIFMRIIFKGMVHPKMKILSSLTLISFPTSMDIISLAENKIRFNIHRTLDTDDYFFFISYFTSSLLDFRGGPFEPLDSVKLKFLSAKKALLTTLTSIKRVRDLQALSVS